MISGVTQIQVTQNAQRVLMNLRDALNQCMAMNEWVQGQTAVDLENLGFSAADVTILQAAFSDVAALFAITHNGTPPTVAKDYTVNATQVIGPQ